MIPYIVLDTKQDFFFYHYSLSIIAAHFYLAQQRLGVGFPQRQPSPLDSVVPEKIHMKLKMKKGKENPQQILEKIRMLLS